MAVGRFKRLILGTGLTGTDNGDDTITVDASGAPTGAAGGDLGGSYPNPEVDVVDDDVLGSGTPSSAKFLRGDRSWNQVTDANLSTSDITTNDVSTSKHGFVPKAPNDAAKFLRGDGSWATVGGSGGGVVANDAIWDTKGDIAAATGADAAIAVPAGANGTRLVANSAATAGVQWNAQAGSALPGSPLNGDVFQLRLGATPYDFIALVYDSTLAKWVSGLIGSQFLVPAETTTSTSYASSATRRVLLPFHKAAYDAGLRLEALVMGDLSNSGANTTSARLQLFEIGDNDTSPSALATTADPTISLAVAAATYRFSAWVPFSYSAGPADAHALIIFQMKTSAGTATADSAGFRLRWVST